MADHSATDATVSHAITDEAKKYRTIFESLPSPVAILDRRGRISTVNHAWKTLFEGLTPPRTDEMTDPPTDASTAWLASVVNKCLSSRKPEYMVEKVVQTARGSRHLSIKTRCMFDIRETFAGCIVIVDDVTLQRQAEAAYQESTIWLKEMFNALEEAVFIATPTGEIVDCNAAVQRIFGYTPAELINQTAEMLHLDQDHYKAFTLHVRETLAKGERVAFEYTAKRKDGESFPTMVNVALLRNTDDTPMGIVCILRDLTALKAAEAATRESERLQGVLELAGAVCHDMNQPLMAINGYAELMLMDFPLTDELPQRLNRIIDQVAKVGDITKKLMRVTRYETKPYLNHRIIDIDKASGS